MNKNLLSILLFISLLISCKGKDETAPAYIHIEDVDFKYENVSTVGNGGTSITDVWVFNNDDLLGVYQLPATIAVTAEGPNEIGIRAGIKLNGISATREYFAFYESWKKDITLTPFDTVVLEPEVKYYSNTQLSFNETFEDVVLKLDTASFSDVSLVRTKINGEPTFLDNYVGLATLTSDKPILKTYNAQLFMVPATSSLPIYLELDYKCNQEFQIAAILQLPGNAATEIQSITLRSTIEDGEMKWKHIYLDLTDYFIGQITASGFGFSITAYHSSVNQEGYIYIDNTKVVNSN
ncbi:MAG: hypothetical protein ACI9GM_000034 [Salibacteraceae bacterium]|jgi:hypothetical protein